LLFIISDSETKLLAEGVGERIELSSILPLFEAPVFALPYVGLLYFVTSDAIPAPKDCIKGIEVGAFVDISP